MPFPEDTSMLSKKELVEDNEELICLLNDILICCEEQGIVLPVDISERVGEFLVIDEDEDGQADVVEIRPVTNTD
jgi:hypothetical protein